MFVPNSISRTFFIRIFVRRIYRVNFFDLFTQSFDLIYTTTGCNIFFVFI